MKEGFPGNKELWFGYASVAGTVITVLYTAYSGYMSAITFNVGITILALCILNFFLVISSISITRRYFRLEQRQRPMELQNNSYQAFQIAVARVNHNISHHARNLISSLYRDTLTQDFSKDKKRETSFEKYLLFLLDNIKEIFDVLTGDQCSVCIKLLVPDTNPELTSVKTHYRDSISFRERSKIDNNLPAYPYYENTAFKVIIKEEFANKFYLCNDLANEKGYTNCHKDWNKSYNACLVVPISMPTKREETNVIIGFICVDNMKGGFDEIVGHNILAAIADLNFLVYKAFQEYNEKKVEYEQKHSTSGTTGATG